MIKIFVTAVSTSLIIGCFISYFFAPDALYLSYVIIVLSVLILLTRHNEKAVLVCVCMLALFLGMFRIVVPERHQDTTPIQEYTGQQAAVEGVVTSDIEDKNTHSRYVVRVTTIDGSNPEKKSSILVYEPYPTKCVTGEKIVFDGRLNKPEDFLTSGNRVFRYERYLRQSGIHAIVNIQESSCTGKKQEHAFFAVIRKRLVTTMNKLLPPQEASLLSGLVLGLRGSFSPDLLDAFRITGLIHIIVLSGYNITLIAESVRRLFSWTPRRISLLVSFMAIIAFVLLAGAQVAAVRAGSMATIALIARATNREYDGIRVLLLVAAIMTLHNPDQVLFSISFHLSFLATLGLLLFSPIFERALRRVPKKYELRGIIAATLATQLFLLPYLAYAIGEISIIGVPVNILVLPIIPIAMLFGSAVTVVTILLPIAGSIIAPIAYIPLRTITFFTEIFSHVPHAMIDLPRVSVVWAAIPTILLTYIGHTCKKNRENKKPENS